MDAATGGTSGGTGGGTGGGRKRPTSARKAVIVEVTESVIMLVS
jgi:hypothetical protein